MSDEIQLYLLGSPEFKRNDQPVLLTSAKAIALLAYLALQDQPQPRDRVLSMLWPDSLANAARKNLRNTLWTLRKNLGDDIVQSSQELLWLDEQVWVDATHFTELTADPKQIEQAIDLYRGLLLDGVTLLEAAEFELWLTQERERLGQLYLRSLTKLINQAELANDWEQVRDLAFRALTRDNLQEPVYRSLMKAYATLGERAKALRQYDRLKAILDDELGVAPLPETEALHQAILAGELTAPAQPISPPRAVATTAFVGRRNELTALESAWHIAAYGSAHIVLLSGEMGIGKTRLWEEWSARRADTHSILAMRCLEATHHIPLAPVTTMLHSTRCMQSLFGPDSPVPPIWLAEMTRLLPQLRASLPKLPTPAELPPDETQHRIFEALVQCLLALEAQPLLLFIDDLHWADQTTLDWLAYLVYRLAQHPLLLVVAYRLEDSPAALVRLKATWTRQRLTQELTLSPLTTTEMSELIHLLKGDDAHSIELQQQSQGNPLFLTELCRVSPNEVPSLLTDVIQTRIEQLPSTAQQVLQAAAILEPDFNFETLQRTSGRSELETLDALDILLSMAFLQESGQKYGFNHPFTATVVRQTLSQMRRTFLHRRAAAARRAVYAADLSSIAGRLVDHYIEAGERTEAAHFATVAAEQALQVAAPTEAIQFYQQAIALEPTAERLMGLGLAYKNQAHLAEARQAYEQALAIFEQDENWLAAVDACLKLAESNFTGGEPANAKPWIERGKRYLALTPDVAQTAMMHLLEGGWHLRAGQSLAQAQIEFETTARLARENNLLYLAARSQFELGNLLGQLDQLEQGLLAFEEAIKLSQTIHVPYFKILILNNAAYHAQLAGDLNKALAYVTEGLTLSEQYAIHSPRQYLYSTRGEIALAQQAWNEAESWFEQGLTVAEQHGNREMIATYTVNFALVAKGRGQLAEALARLKSARRELTEIAAPYLQLQIDLYLTELHLARAEAEAAKSTLERVWTQLEQSERLRLRRWAERLRAQLGEPS